MFFSVLDHFDEDARSALSSGLFALGIGSIDSYLKSAVNGLLHILFWFPNKIFTQKILISGRTAAVSAFHRRLL